MTTNPKNRLQEFCQKKGLDLPRYETRKIDPNEHPPRFKSRVTITLNDNSPNPNINLSGDIKSSKKSAELSAAAHMLEIIKDIQSENVKRYPTPTDRSVYVYIDMENVHVGDFFDHHEFPDVGYYFQGFATENHPSIRNPPSNINIITTKSDHKDAADTLMIYWIGSAIHSLQGNVIIIVTKDHFAASLVEILNGKHGRGSQAYRCKSVEELDTVLNSLVSE